jgi:hypothetical protein
MKLANAGRATPLKHPTLPTHREIQNNQLPTSVIHATRAIPTHIFTGTGALHLSARTCVCITLHPELHGRELLQKTVGCCALAQHWLSLDAIVLRAACAEYTKHERGGQHSILRNMRVQVPTYHSNQLNYFGFLFWHICQRS